MRAWKLRVRALSPFRTAPSLARAGVSLRGDSAGQLWFFIYGSLSSWVVSMVLYLGLVLAEALRGQLTNDRLHYVLKGCRTEETMVEVSERRSHGLSRCRDVGDEIDSVQCRKW